jgi:hypothetical protein
VVRCLSAAAVLSFSIPKAKVSADLIAAYNFTGASSVSTAKSPIPTAGNYVFNSRNTNQHNASAGLSNLFVNLDMHCLILQIHGRPSWPATLASHVGQPRWPTRGAILLQPEATRKYPSCTFGMDLRLRKPAVSKV